MTKTLTDKKLIKEFQDNLKSTREIGREYGMHHETVRRRLKRLGVETRSHSEAQKLYCDKHGSQAEGAVRSNETKEQISRNMTKYWEDMPEKIKNKKKKILKKRASDMWNSYSEGEKIEKLHKLTQDRLKTAREGSKSERFLVEVLERRGIKTDFHSTRYTGGQFEVDILLPDELIVIEVDGPTHFAPLFGEDRLAEIKAKDAIKNDTLILNGITVVRAKNNNTGFKQSWCYRVADEIEKMISNKRNKPKVIYLEVD